MTPAAAKGEKLFLLAAALLAATAALLAPASSEASRYLPQALEPVQAPLASLEDLAGRDADDHPALPALTAADRLDLVDLAAGARLEAQRLGLHLAPGELGAARKTASGGQTWGLEANVRLISEMGLKTRRPTFQGLWTDPVTGLSYARARWYDARNASWLSEDPLLDVDSPNLYAFVGWGPHVGTDPMGLELRWYDWFGIAGDALVGTGADTAQVAANLVTLGGYGGVKEAYRRGELDKGGMAGLDAYAEGMASGLTLGWYGTTKETTEAGGTVGEGTATWAGDVSGYTDIAEGGTKLGEGEILEGTGRILSGTGKIAGLATLGVTATRYSQGLRNAGSRSAFNEVRSAQRMPTSAGTTALGKAGEKALTEIIGPDAQYQHVMKQAVQQGSKTVSRAVRFNNTYRRLDALETTPRGLVASEVKNGFLESIDRGQVGWDAAALRAGRLQGYNYYLLRGGSPAAIQALRDAGFQAVDFSPLMGPSPLDALAILESQYSAEEATQ